VRPEGITAGMCKLICGCKPLSPLASLPPPFPLSLFALHPHAWQVNHVRLLEMEKKKIQTAHERRVTKIQKVLGSAVRCCAVLCRPSACGVERWGPGQWARRPQNGVHCSGRLSRHATAPTSPMSPPSQQPTCTAPLPRSSSTHSEPCLRSSQSRPGCGRPPRWTDAWRCPQRCATVRACVCIEPTRVTHSVHEAFAPRLDLACRPPRPPPPRCFTAPCRCPASRNCVSVLCCAVLCCAVPSPLLADPALSDALATHAPAVRAG
jgi:hypothetical protein